MRAWQTKIDNTAPTDTGILSAGEDNARGKEMSNAVSTAGITPDAYDVETDTDFNMLAQAMARYASGGIFAQDGGAANAYVLTTPLTFVMPKAYFKGMMIEFYPANANSGASTVNAFSIGSKKILSPSGAALTGGELDAGVLTSIVYDPALDSGAGAFKIKPWAAISTTAETDNYLNLLIYPEVEETDGRLTVSNLGGGSLQIAASQTFLWRGWTRIETDDFSSGDRTLTTLANKTYHIRWHAPGTGDATPAETYPSGRFVIKDLSNVGYNPSTLAEDNTAFDSTYDDMLIARVVTNGSNVATVTTLANKERLTLSTTHSGTPTDPGAAEFTYTSTFTANVNWGRTPTQHALHGYVFSGSPGAEVSGGVSHTWSFDRYSYSLTVSCDWNEGQGAVSSRSSKGYVSLGA